MSKKRIIQDFGRKQKTYVQDNYEVESTQNYLRRLRNRLIRERLVPPASASIVLDVGCGPGILYPETLAAAGMYYALDLTQSNLDEIRRANPGGNIELLLSDLDGFEWPACFFDIVICSGVIEYTDEPEENLIKLLGLLKPGGTLVCSFPNLGSPYRIFGEYVFKPLWVLKRRITGQPALAYRRRLFSRSRILAYIRQHVNPESIDVRYFGLKLIPQPLDKYFAGFDFRICESFEARRARFLEGLCQEFLLTIRK